MSSPATAITNHEFRTCATCRKTKSKTEFRLLAKGKLTIACNTCAYKAKRQYYAENRDKYRERQRKTVLKQRGITRDDYDAILERQGGKCAICGSRDTGNRKHKLLYVDHDHATGYARGLLCLHCNAGLGFFKDSPIRLQAAIAYLSAPTYSGSQIPSTKYAIDSA